MPIRPIIAREMLVNSRRARTYSTRATFAFVLLGAFYALMQAYRWNCGDVLTVEQMASLARYTFYLFVAIQALITLSVVPEMVASSIAQEKERRTLSGLLITHVYSIDVVLGKFIARFLLYLYSMLFCVPVCLLLCFWGGIRPLQIVLAYAGIASTALFVAALGIFVSTLARSARKATQTTASVTAIWLIGPFVVTLLGTFVLPAWLMFWIGAPARWLNGTTPLFLGPQLLFSAVTGRMTAGMVVGQFTDMVQMQLGMAACLILAAIWRLRPTYRHQEGGDGRTLGVRIRTWNWRILPRRGVGDDPVFWRELYTSRYQGVVKLLNLVVAWALFAGLLYGLARFGWPAAQDVFAAGYSGSVDSPARKHLNQFVRIIFAWLVGIWMLIIAGGAATSIPTERDRDTWLSLLATPLSGLEILRAKMLAAILRCAPCFAAAFIMAVVGLAAGALNPLALAVACLLAVAATFFAASIGVWFSLSVKVTGNASGSALGILVGLAVLPPMLSFNENLRTILNCSTCVPYLIFAALLSPQQASAIWDRNPAMVASEIGVPDGEGWLRALAAIGFGIFAYAAAAIGLFWHAQARFERAVGRPVRAAADRPRGLRATLSNITGAEPATPL
jgi:ABC-type Na+ efflux pump permease subunit